MKFLSLLTIFTLLLGCSKQSETPLVIKKEEKNEAFSESLKDISDKQKYALLKLEDSQNKKLEVQKSLFETYEKITLILIKKLSERDDSIEELTQELNEVRNHFQTVLKDFEDLKRIREDISAVEISLNNIRNLSGDYKPEELINLNLRDQFLDLSKNYLSLFSNLKTKFPNEIKKKEIQSFEEKKKLINPVQLFFSPLSNFKIKRKKIINKLSKMGFDFQEKDHTLVALEYEQHFFNLLENYNNLSLSFKKEYHSLLKHEEIKSIETKKLIIDQTFKNLDLMKSLQDELREDFSKIFSMGYTFPQNIESLSPDKLKWVDKEIYLSETIDLRTEWSIGYHIVGPRYNASTGDLLSLKNHWYKLIEKEDYPQFEELFASTFTKITLYLGKYIPLGLSKEKQKEYDNKALLIAKAYEIVTYYYESL